MAEIRLSGGKIWFIRDYSDSGFDRTLNSQSMENMEEPGQLARKQRSVDLDLPYLGTNPEYAFSGPLRPGTVVSRDRVETEYHDGGILTGSDERKELRNVYPRHFRSALREKYRDFEDTSLVFLNPGEGPFTIRGTDAKPLYTSSVDLMVISDTGDLDESYSQLWEVREEVGEDLQRMADTYLED